MENAPLKPGDHPPADYAYIRVYVDPARVAEGEDPYVYVYDRKTGEEIDGFGVWARVMEEEAYMRSWSQPDPRLYGKAGDTYAALRKRGGNLTQWARENMKKVYLTSSYAYWKRAPDNVIFKPDKLADPGAIYCESDFKKSHAL